jgi:hypothetical protein
MTTMLFGKMVNIDPRFGNNFIDANVLDRKGTPEDKAVDAILRLAEDGEFTLLLPYSVQKELEHPNTPKEVKRRAAGLIFSMRVHLTEQEKATHRRIRDLIRGNAQSNQHDADAFHLVESQCEFSFKLSPISLDDVITAGLAQAFSVLHGIRTISMRRLRWLRARPTDAIGKSSNLVAIPPNAAPAKTANTKAMPIRIIQFPTLIGTR